MNWFLFLLFAWFFIPQASASVDWSVDQGWVTATESGTRLFARGEGPAADIQVNDARLLTKSTISPLVIPLATGGWVIRYEVEGVGRLEDQVSILPGLDPDGWIRRLVYTNLSGATQDLTSARMRVAPVLRDGGKTWLPTHFFLGEVSGGKTAGVGFKGTTDFSTLSFEGARVESDVQAAWRLRPGQQATIGNQGIWLGSGGVEFFRAEAQRWYSAIGFQLTQPLPQWVREAILYETAASGHIDSRFSDVGGFKAFEHQMDYLADLGISAIWYNSVHTHKTPPDPVHGGWNHYAPLNFEEIDPILGGVEGFRSLVAATKDRGMHPLCEVILWGGYSKQAKALSGWWVSDRVGKPLNPWGAGYTMDYSSPDWQRVIHDSVAMLAHEGIEGVRIDVADGHGANWSSPRTHQASYTTLGGAVEMLEAIRQGCGVKGIEPVLIPETAVDHPEYLHRGITIGYGFGTTNLLSALIDPREDPTAINQRLRDFFENERGSLPAGTLVLRTLNNHDTVCEHGRVMQRYGVGMARALYGVCLCVPGVPMMYQEEEYGSFEALRAMNWGRRRIPEMANGEPDYLSISVAPEVFTVLRSSADSHALGLVNLSGKVITNLKIELPIKVAQIGDGKVYDAVSGRIAEISSQALTWTLAPYETSLLRIGARPVGDTPPIRFTGEDSRSPSAEKALSVSASTEGLLIECGGIQARLSAGASAWKATQETAELSAYESEDGTMILSRSGKSTRAQVDLRPEADDTPPSLEILHADNWGISGRTAFVEDRLLRRHYPFPPETNYRWDRTMIWGSAPWRTLYNQVLPNGRLWQSVLEPLHPGAPGFVFHDRVGGGLVLSEVSTDAANIVLTDRSDESPTRPYGLALRFHGVDRDLSSEVRNFGVGSGWQMENYPEPVPTAVHLSFALSPCGGAEEAKLREIPRLPILQNRPVETRSKTQFGIDSFDAIWMIEPGSVTWSQLPPVKGDYRLAFELRHSETSAEGHELEKHYRVLVNSIEQPLEWYQPNIAHTGNAFFGMARTPVLNLDHGPNWVLVESTHSWCAVRGRLRLVP
jgi:hypothetical protein